MPSTPDRPQVADSDGQIRRCYPVMAELRPQVAAEAFVPLVREMQRYGYRLAYLEAAGEVVCVAGYRLSLNFFHGHHLYVEDLVTAASARSAGHGATMLAWLRAQARRTGCRFLDLDSGTQRHRAHRFYLTQGMAIVAFHFAEDLDQT